jgi:hypothetical protein
LNHFLGTTFADQDETPVECNFLEAARSPGIKGVLRSMKRDPTRYDRTGKSDQVFVTRRKSARRRIIAQREGKTMETATGGHDNRPETKEDRVTKEVEQYTAAIPSIGYLGAAIGAMGLSLAFEIVGRGKWGNFIAQWVPTLLIIGVYNKLVKLEGHDKFDRA